MATTPSVDNEQNSMLQKQAIEKARSAFSHLPNEDAIFQQCIGQRDSIPDIIKSAIRTSRSYKERQSTRLLQKFEQHTQFLQNASDVVDTVVQTQAGIGCPLWAPIKFVLIVSKNHAQAAEQVLNLIEVTSENHPRFEIYGKLPPDPILQIALLNIFTDVVEFSVRAIRFFRQSAPVRITRLLVRPFKQEFGDIFDRLKRRTEVVDLTAMATQLLRATESHQETQKFRCQSWLKPPNVRDFYRQVHSKLPGTCDWIKENPTFVKWNEPPSSLVSDRLLCISGTHGCGKTTLASSIIEDLKSKQLQTLFFYFSGRDASLQNLDSMVRAFLWQLLQDTNDQRSLELVDALALKGPPAVTDLVQALNEIAKLVAGPVYCVIDGVDEYIDERDDKIETLIQLVLGLLKTNNNFRAVLLGRQHVLQPHVLQAAIGGTPLVIEINSSLIKQDIVAFIDTEIDAKIDANLLRYPGMRDSILETLQNKSDGMFLWVELMIKDLRKSASPSEVAERLHNPPRKLEDIYRRLFLRLVKKLDKFQLNLVKSILAFTIISFRAFQVDELQYALALSSGSISTFKERLLLHPAQVILDACGDFINIRDSVVQLNHFSVKEFLTRAESEWRCSGDQEILDFRVDLEAWHSSLGSTCVDYLRSCEYGFPLSDTDTFLDLGVRYPFIKYATIYTPFHLSLSGPPSSALVQKSREFIGSQNFASWIECLVILIVKDDSATTLDEYLERLRNWLDSGEYSFEAEFNKLLMCLDQELQKRIRTFGEHDSRAIQWQFLRAGIQDSFLNADAEKDNNFESITGTLPITLSEPATVSHILGALNDSILPLHRQADMVFRLQFHLQKAKVITDPLKMLFRIILQKGHAVPVYALLAIGNFYHRLDKLDEAVEVYSAALAKIGTQQTPISFKVQSSIGNVLWQQEKYQQAEVIYRRLCKARKSVLGKEHLATLNSMNDLGASLGRQGKNAESEVIHRETLQLMEKVLGKEHPDTLITMNNLGISLHEQDKHAEAELIYRETLQLMEKLLGKEHLDTLSIMHNLGSSLEKQDKDAEAEVIYRRKLQLIEKVLGKEHLDTLLSMSNLGATLYNQAKYAEAEVIYRETLRLREKMIGKEHPDTLENVKDLEDCLRWASTL